LTTNVEYRPILQGHFGLLAFLIPLSSGSGPEINPSKIARYKQLAVQITDKLTLDGIEQLIKRMKAGKVDLDGEQE